VINCRETDPEEGERNAMGEGSPGSEFQMGGVQDRVRADFLLYHRGKSLMLLENAIGERTKRNNGRIWGSGKKKTSSRRGGGGFRRSLTQFGDSLKREASEKVAVSLGRKS